MREVKMDKIKVKETAREYEVEKSDLVPAQGEEERTWYNTCLLYTSPSPRD